MHNIIVAVEQMIPDLQKKWTRFGDNRRVYAIDIFKEDGVVCPMEGLFTTGNLDNLDHNPSSTLAVTAFHGTAISLIRHVTVDNRGTECHQNSVLLSKETPKTRTINH